MEISSRKIKTKKTATFYTAGNKDSKKHIYLFHGYAQNAKDFLAEFEYLSKDYFLISIQGLSAFYGKGVFGDVAYSWMTKENREDEIKDYLNLIKNIYSEFSKYSENNCFIGFSQGSQTAARWFNTMEKESSNNLILCGGLVPNDCEKVNQAHIIIGNSDKFIPAQNLKSFKENNPLYHYHDFNGGHVINHEAVRSILSNI